MLQKKLVKQDSHKKYAKTLKKTSITYSATCSLCLEDDFYIYQVQGLSS